MTDSKDTQVLDSFTTDKMTPFGATMPRVVSEYGKSFSSQVKDLFSLSVRNNKLSPDEYYQMKLFDDKNYSSEDKKKFVGITKSRQIWSTIDAVNPWYGFMKDKYAAEKLLNSFGLPITETIAVIGGNYPGENSEIGSLDELRAFFNSAELPVFGKPVNANRSLGSARFSAYDQKTDELTLSNDRKISAEKLWHEIVSSFNGEYLFQKCLEANSSLKDITGGGLPTVRIVTLDSGNGPQVYRCCMKLTGNGNVADNFWRKGNLLAPIDSETGALQAALTAMGIDGKLVTHHPDTGAKIEETVVPFWEEAKALSLSVAEFYKNALLIGFDIAITDDGPVIVEVNNDPHLIMLQIAFQKGVLDQPMLDSLKYAEELKSSEVQKFKSFKKNEELDRKQKMNEALSKKVA